MDEVKGEWRRLYKDEINDLYFSRNIIRVIKSRIIRWEGHIVRMEERRGEYSVLMEKSEEKRPFGRPKRRWDHNIEKDPGKEVEWWYGLD